MVCTRPGQHYTEPIPCTAGAIHTWFHIVRRLKVLEQYARGVAHHDEKEGAWLLSELEGTKWLLWHGTQCRAQQHANGLRDDVKALEMDYPHLGKFVRSAQEFADCTKSHSGSLINYGKRFRAGERISSAMAESTVKALVSKRFAKRQQMHWTHRGAHLLLQTRTRALGGTLRPLFERWRPGLANNNPASAGQAAAA